MSVMCDVVGQRLNTVRLVSKYPLPPVTNRDKKEASSIFNFDSRKWTILFAW